MQTRPKVRPKIRIGHNVAIIYPFYQGKCDKYLQGAFPLFVPYCCAVTLTVAMQLSPQPSVAFTRSSAASYRCSEASASLHLARQKIKLFYSLKTSCAWRNPLFWGEVCRCAWLLVFVFVNVIVVKLFENNFTPILDIDTTRGIHHRAALQVVVGGEDFIYHRRCYRIARLLLFSP